MTERYVRTVTHDQGTVRELSEVEINAASGATSQTLRPIPDTLCWNNFGTHRDIDD